MNLVQAIKAGGKFKRKSSDVLMHINNGYVEGVNNDGYVPTVEDMVAEDWFTVSKELSGEDIKKAIESVFSKGIVLGSTLASDLNKELGLE